LAKQLENLGCATVMPLGSPIGSGQGIKNFYNIEILIENAQIPIIIDAGIGTPSQAALAMEMGAGGVLTNTAIAKAGDSIVMAKAMKMGVSAGRKAFLAGKMVEKAHAVPSSPVVGLSSL